MMIYSIVGNLHKVLIATRGSEERHWHEICGVLRVLHEQKAANNFGTRNKFCKKIEWLGFRLSHEDTVPFEKKIF